MPKFHWFDAAKLHNYLDCSYFYEYFFRYGGGVLVGGEVIFLLVLTYCFSAILTKRFVY
jgi:hypothetical protein